MLTAPTISRRAAPYPNRTTSSTSTVIHPDTLPPRKIDTDSITTVLRRVSVSLRLLPLLRRASSIRCSPSPRIEEAVALTHTHTIIRGRNFPPFLSGATTFEVDAPFGRARISSSSLGVSSFSRHLPVLLALFLSLPVYELSARERQNSSRGEAFPPSSHPPPPPPSRFSLSLSPTRPAIPGIAREAQRCLV